MGLEGRLKRLEQNLEDADLGGAPPQEYYDARARSTRHLRALVRLGTGEELGEDERQFVEDYRDSALMKDDRQLIRRYEPPRSPEETARAREWIKESLAAMVRRRRELGQ